MTGIFYLSLVCLITSTGKIPTMELSNNQLLQNNSFINNMGECNNLNTFDVTNPANESVVTNVADCGAAETEQAIKAASEAFPAWSKKTAKERSLLMRKWFNLINENLDDLALLMTTEQGKPLRRQKEKSFTEHLL